MVRIEREATLKMARTVKLKKMKGTVAGTEKEAKRRCRPILEKDGK